MPRDILYENVLRPLLFMQDPEDVHHFISRAMVSLGPILSAFPWLYKGEDLRVNLFGRTFNNPVGLAAGFDKNGALLSILGHLGFGFAEIGSVCARPYGGNPKPRIFRLPEDEAVINWLGLNGLGAETVLNRLRATKTTLPYAVNIAKTADPSIVGDEAVRDYVYTFSRLKDLPVSFVVINVSCPNTKEGCSNETDLIKTVLREVAGMNNQGLPILLKLSPESTEEFLSNLLGIASDDLVQGFICGNTSLRREGLKTTGPVLELKGGLSGRPLKTLNLALTKKVRQLKTKSQIIIGIGGISSGQDAYDYIQAGASLVEVYTGMVYRGPSTAKQICEELSQLLQRDGVNLQQFIDQR